MGGPGAYSPRFSPMISLYTWWWLYTGLFFSFFSFLLWIDGWMDGRMERVGVLFILNSTE